MNACLQDLRAPVAPCESSLYRSNASLDGVGIPRVVRRHPLSGMKPNYAKLSDDHAAECGQNTLHRTRTLQCMLRSVLVLCSLAPLHSVAKLLRSVLVLCSLAPLHSVAKLLKQALQQIAARAYT